MKEDINQDEMLCDSKTKDKEIERFRYMYMHRKNQSFGLCIYKQGGRKEIKTRGFVKRVGLRWRFLRQIAIKKKRVFNEN